MYLSLISMYRMIHVQDKGDERSLYREMYLEHLIQMYHNKYIG